MKFLFSIQAIAGIYFLYDCSRLAGCQFYEDVSRHFVPMEFAQQHRGSFNISDCVRDLLNCWEFIKPDHVCTGSIIFESLCGLLRHECTDAQYWVSPMLAPIHEGFCDSI